MPITGIGSYGPTTLEFDTNWIQANSELGTAPLLLAGDYARTDFDMERTAILTAIDNVTTLATTARDNAADRDSRKFALLQRHKQLRGGVLGSVAAPDYLKALPAAPQLGLDRSKFLAPLKAAAHLWERINAAAAALGLSGPLTVVGGYTVAQFNADITALDTTYDTAARSEEAVGFARSDRDTKMGSVYIRLKQYRQKAPSVLPSSSPARRNLPRLTPAPGTTPNPLAVSGAWDAQLGSARLTWTATPDANVSKLQVRGCTGVYKNNNEEVVADLPATATHWEGDWGLTAPGAIASFKVYVMTSTGNENGGKAVKVVRPGM